MQTKPEDIRARDGTLVIVDMQPGYTFDCKNPQLLASVLQEIEAAMKLGWAVIALEVAPWKMGETDDAIKALIRGYKRFQVKRKSTDDGSCEVIETCDKYGFDKENFRVVGVYIDACVVDTAVSLVERLSRATVRVIKSACSTNFDEPGAWAAFRRRNRLVVA